MDLSGARFFKQVTRNANRHTVPAEEVESAWSHYRSHVETGLWLPTSLDESDLEVVGKYLELERTTWERILAGGNGGLSLLIHEVTEIHVLQENQVDPFDRGRKWYPLAHGEALLAEHGFLFALARKNGYNIREMGSLIIANPFVAEDDEVASPGYEVMSGWRKDLQRARAAAKRLGKGPVEVAAADGLEVRRFYAELKAGRVP
jgi:hypothetical protein